VETRLAAIRRYRRAVTIEQEAYTWSWWLPRSVLLPAVGKWRTRSGADLFSGEEAASRGDHFLEVIARLKPNVTLRRLGQNGNDRSAPAQQYRNTMPRGPRAVNPGTKRSSET